MTAFSFIKEVIKAGTEFLKGQEITIPAGMSDDINYIFKVRGRELPEGGAELIALESIKQEGDAATEFWQEMKLEAEELEPEIKKIILTATGDENSDFATAIWIREYILHPYNDPQESLEILQGYAKLTELVVQKMLDSKYHQDNRRRAKAVEPSLKRFNENTEDFIQGVRETCWQHGPDMIEFSLKHYLKRFYAHKSEDKFKHARLERLIFGGKEVAEQYEPDRKKPARERHLKVTGAKDAIRKSSSRNILEEISDLLNRENNINAGLLASIADYKQTLPPLIKNLQDQAEERCDIAEMFAEQQSKAEKLIDEKNSLLIGIQCRNGNIDGYETPDEWKTLIASRRVAASSFGDGFLDNESPQSARASIPAQFLSHDDLKALIEKDSNPDILSIARDIEILREENIDLQIEEKHSELQARQLRKRIESCHFEIEKITSRTIALEEIISSLENDVRDLTLEAQAMETHTSGQVVSAYPPLDQLENWADKNLKNRVEIHRNAFNEAARLSLTYKRPEWIYQGLELLANEYWEQITSGDHDNDTAQGLRAAFNEKLQDNRMRIGGSIQDLRTERQRQQYHQSFDGGRYFMDQHLRRGTSRDQNNILCVYFTWRSSDRKVLVGHLPTHLELARG